MEEKRSCVLKPSFRCLVINSFKHAVFRIEEFVQLIANETTKWAKVIKFAKIAVN